MQVSINMYIPITPNLHRRMPFSPPYWHSTRPIPPPPTDVNIHERNLIFEFLSSQTADSSLTDCGVWLPRRVTFFRARGDYNACERVGNNVHAPPCLVAHRGTKGSLGHEIRWNVTRCTCDTSTWTLAFSEAKVAPICRNDFRSLGSVRVWWH